jgi:hypothetical protein
VQGRLGLGKDRRIDSRIEEILIDHLRVSPRAQGTNGWKYRQRLVKYFRLPSFWTDVAEMIPLHQDGVLHTLSLQEALKLSVITVFFGDPEGVSELSVAAVITTTEVEALSQEHRRSLFEGRLPSNPRWTVGDHLALDWVRPESPSTHLSTEPPIEVVDWTDDYMIGFAAHKTCDDVYEVVILNSLNPLVEWLVRVEKACSDGSYGLTRGQFERVLGLLDDSIRYHSSYKDRLETYLQGWRAIPGLPPDLRPPEIELEQSKLRLQPPNASERDELEK